MSRFRYRDEESHAGAVIGVLVGAVAGFVAGMYVAQRVGGFGGLSAKLRSTARGARSAFGEAHGVSDEDDHELDDFEEDELESEDSDDALEQRVLEAFRNDPLLAERAIDIGSVGEGVIELAGWVDSEDEAQMAVTIARGVPGVD